MENPKHLTDFKVENFKCFESFEMNDIGQFNLIVGDNNVGKTSVLEALLFDGDVSSLNWYWREIVKSRNNFNSDKEEDIDIYPFIYNAKNSDKKIVFRLNSVTTSVFYRRLNELDKNEQNLLEKSVFYGFGRKLQPENYFLVGYKGENLDSLVSQFEMKRRLDNYVPIIYLKNTYGFDLVNQYSSQQNENKDTREFYIQQLKRHFIRDLESMEVITAHPFGPQITLSLEGIQRTMPLSSQGEGSIKLFRILLEINECAGQKLMIDEIDAGVHFSRLPNFWKTILTAAMEKKVQLFMTTHSQECIKYYKDWQKKRYDKWRKKNPKADYYHFLKSVGYATGDKYTKELKPKVAWVQKHLKL